jgi:hypothetical protein
MFFLIEQYCRVPTTTAKRDEIGALAFLRDGNGRALPKKLFP